MGVQDLGDFIFRGIEARELTVKQFAELAGVKRQTLYNLKDGKTTSPDLMTLVQIARALGVHPRRLTAVLLKDLERRPVGVVHAKGRPPLYPGDASLFVDDVTIPDYDIVLVGERFEKQWAIQNLGSVPWSGRRLVCQTTDVSEDVRFGSLQPDEAEIAIPETAPGETVVLAMTFTAPTSPATVKSYWKMVDANGISCFPGLHGVWCVVTVLDP